MHARFTLPGILWLGLFSTLSWQQKQMSHRWWCKCTWVRMNVTNVKFEWRGSGEGGKSYSVWINRTITDPLGYFAVGLQILELSKPVSVEGKRTHDMKRFKITTGKIGYNIVAPEILQSRKCKSQFTRINGGRTVQGQKVSYATGWLLSQRQQCLQQVEARWDTPAHNQPLAHSKC